MNEKLSYEALEKKVQELEIELLDAKQIEEALRESEMMVEKAERISHVGIWRLQPATNEIKWSDELYRIFGLQKQQPTDLLTKAVELIHPDDRTHAIEISEASIAAKKPYSVQYRIIRPDNTVRHAVTIAEIVFDDKEEVLEVIGIVQDITERKQAEEQLHEKIVQLDSILSNAPLVFSAVNLEGEFILSEGKGLEALGRKPGQFVGISVFDLYKNNPDILEYIRRAMSGESVKAIVELGSEVFDVNYEPIRDDNGKIGGVVAVSNIVTERKQAEAELEKYRKHLELMVEERTTELKKTQEVLLQKEKLAAIGQLSGSVAHDIRNPLGAIKNSIYFLNLISNDSTDDKVKEHLKLMEMEITKASDIINDLLNFSRENEPIMVEGQINNTISDLLKGFTIPKKITVETELDPMLPMLLFDALQIQRAFYNLITNAFQAMVAGGLLKISSSKSDGFIKVQVQDSGTGISPEALENIFDPLFTTKSKGVGLGLTIVKTFVEKHNGLVEVSSEVEKGTTFTVKLPIIQEETT
jgi:PAS domain S-box-containing protein